MTFQTNTVRHQNISQSINQSVNDVFEIWSTIARYCFQIASTVPQDSIIIVTSVGIVNIVNIANIINMVIGQHCQHCQHCFNTFEHFCCKLAKLCVFGVKNCGSGIFFTDIMSVNTKLVLCQNCVDIVSISLSILSKLLH